MRTTFSSAVDAEDISEYEQGYMGAAEVDDDISCFGSCCGSEVGAIYTQLEEIEGERDYMGAVEVDDDTSCFVSCCCSEVGAIGYDSEANGVENQCYTQLEESEEDLPNGDLPTVRRDTKGEEMKTVSEEMNEVKAELPQDNPLGLLRHVLLG